MLSDNNANNKPKSKLSKEQCSKVYPEVHVGPINFLNEQHEIFKCSKDSKTLSDILSHSKNRKNDLISALDDRFVPNYDQKHNEISSKRDIFSSLVSNNFNLSNLMLPIDVGKPNTVEDFCNGTSIGDFFSNKFFISFIIALMAILIVFFLFYFCSLRDIPKHIFCKILKFT